MKNLEIREIFSLSLRRFLLIIPRFDGFLRLPRLVRMAAFASRHDGEGL
jgi:hypothetical protein